MPFNTKNLTFALLKLLINKILTKISIVFNIVFICGIIVFTYKSYPRIQQKLFPKTSVEIKEQSLKNTSSLPIVYYDVPKFEVIGKLPQTEIYTRLPKEAKNNVREPVWNLSQNTAGISIRFTSNTTSITS